MAQFYMAIVQAVLLYGADSWTVKLADMKKLQTFHRRTARYMTGQHIRKQGENLWSYPDHEDLLCQCRLLPIERYLERCRGTLRAYLARVKPDFLGAAMETSAPAGATRKILWWRQPWLSRQEMNDLRGQWAGP